MKPQRRFKVWDQGCPPEGEIFTEDQIKATYYPYWQEQMKKRWGDKPWPCEDKFENALDDWIVVNWAVELS